MNTYRQNQPKKTLGQLREAARKSLRGAWAIAIIAMLIAGMLGAQLATTGSNASVTIGGAAGGGNFDFSTILDGENEQDSVGIIGGKDSWSGEMTLPTQEELEQLWSEIEDAFGDVDFELLLAGFLIGALIGLLTSLALALLVGTAMRIGHLRFRLMLIDGDRAEVGKIFSGFDRSYLPAIGLRLLKALYTFLWGLPSLLFLTVSVLSIVRGVTKEWTSLDALSMTDPTLLVAMLSMVFSWVFAFLPVIATYRYAMSDYILAENPDIPVSEAIAESARMMEGNKWRLFCLELSFIGWVFLCLLSGGIGFLWLNPYMYQAEAAMYHEISGREAIHDAVLDMKELMEQL